MKKLSHLLYYWLPPVTWMLVIFFMSSRPHFGITNSFLYDFIIFKLLHMIEYALLYFLLFRALHKTKGISQKKQFLYAFLIAFVYAVSDEVHQLFVPTREGRFRDIIIDTSGMIFIYLFIRYNIDSIKKYL